MRKARVANQAQAIASVTDYTTEELAVIRDFLRRGREISEEHVERITATAKPRGSSPS